jgi:tellurite resistance protein TehA-like permease
MAGSSGGVMPIVGVFLAGAVSVVVFHQLAFWILNQIGVAPPVAWSLNPTKPLGVPALLSNAFFGGLWALPMAWLLRGRSGAGYWWFAIIFGAVVLTLVAWFPVAMLKGQPTILERPLGIGIIIGPVVNGAWGFGTALVLKLLPPGWAWR